MSERMRSSWDARWMVYCIVILWMDSYSLLHHPYLTRIGSADDDDDDDGGDGHCDCCFNPSTPLLNTTLIILPHHTSTKLNQYVHLISSSNQYNSRTSSSKTRKKPLGHQTQAQENHQLFITKLKLSNYISSINIILSPLPPIDMHHK